MQRKLAMSTMLALLFAGCASEESFLVRVMRPAPVTLGQYDLVAVDRFAGDGSEQLAAELSDALHNAQNPLTGQADFEVVDRSEVDRMLDELGRRRGSDWQNEQMSVLDKWRQADVVIRGDVHVYEVAEDVSAGNWNDKQGVPHTTYTRRCTANVSVVIEATDTSGDRVFDSVQYDEVASDSSTAVDGEPVSIDHEALLAAARRSIVGRYLQRVMPHEESVRVKLYTDGDLPGLQIGNGFARTGDWGEALRSYQEALELATGELAASRYKPLFNMGVALLYTNQFEEARKALKQAYALEQDESILSELNHVSYREQEYQALEEQGRKTASPAR